MKTTLLLGSTVIDMIVRVAHLPVTQQDINTRSMDMALGGCSYNAARLLRLFRLPMFHCSPTGEGVFAEITENLLKQEGLSVSVRVHGKDNGCCLCLVEDGGERTFLSYHGAEYGFDPQWLEGINPQELDYVYLCGIEVEEPTGMAMLEWLKEHPGPEIFFAPGARLNHLNEQHWQRLRQCRPILHLNEAEALQLSGKKDIHEAAMELGRQFHNAVIVTLGSRGALCLEQDGRLTHIEGIPVQVADTIGAGDCHAGTILACLKLGWPLTKATALANRMSAQVVSVPSARLDETQFKQVLSDWCENSPEDLPQLKKCGIL